MSDMAQSHGYASEVPLWTLGWRLRRAREYADLTQQELATNLEIGLRVIKEGESDKQPPKQWQIVAWALACGVSPDWLKSGVITDAVSDDLTHGHFREWENQLALWEPGQDFTNQILRPDLSYSSVG